jgi:hypothetical protein
MNQMFKLTLLVIGLSLLSGCAETVFRTKLEIYCPPINDYSDQFNEQLADELDALPEDSWAIPEAMFGYIKLRDRVKSCQEEKKNYGNT